MAHVVALHGERRYRRMHRGQMLRHERIDDVLAAPINDRGDRLAVDVIEAAAEQRETLRGRSMTGR